MQCPNCQADVREGAAFCDSCGAAAAPAVAGAAEPVLQPTSPMPAAPAADQAAYDAAVYAQQMAEYERQKAAYDQQQYAQQQAAYQQQQAAYAASAPAPKKKTGCIIGVVIILVLLLLGCGVGGYFAYRAWRDKADDAPGITTPTAGDVDDTGAPDADNALDSYSTADEAVQAQLDASGCGDWVYQLYDEGDGYATYWAGPPNSEYVDEIYLEQNPDGTWSVIEVSSLDFGGDVSDGAIDLGNDAMLVVDQHLTYVSNDQGLEAQSLTVDPFHSDSASAQVSAGGFDYYEITGYTEQSDGSFWVQTTQSWYGSVEDWEYWVVPTEAGFRIADIRPL